MVELSLQNINSTASYQVEHGAVDGSFKFTSESGATFGVAFEQDCLLQTTESYQFLPMSVYDEEDNENYTALIIRKDHPRFNDVVFEYTKTVNILNGKPKE